MPFTLRVSRHCSNNVAVYAISTSACNGSFINPP